MERNLAFEASPEGFRGDFLAREEELSRQIEHARTLIDEVGYTSRDLLSIAQLTASLHVDGHRADLVILKAARAQAAFDGRRSITGRDIALAAELALPHRIRRGPFQQDEITMEELQDRIEGLQGASSTTGRSSEEMAETDSEQARQKKA
jgi:Mg-chelatase subunit ChlI